MRTFARKRESGDSAERDAPPRGPSSLARVQRAVGNHAIQHWFASHDEGEARVAEDRARREPADGALMSEGTLSDAGRRYFAPLVGEAAGRARIHVGGRADQLAELAGAESLSYGDDVFIPGERFSAESPKGRGLLAHELSHVARSASGPPRLARKPNEVEPHYPTPSEQKAITKILDRDFSGPGTVPEEEPTVPGEPPKPAVKRGRALNATERLALAASLEQPFFDTIDSMDHEEVKGTEPILGESAAFEVIEQARKDVLAEFANYITRSVTMTRDPKIAIADREARNEVLVHYGVSPSTSRAFAATVVDTYCKECKEKLSDLDDASKQAVKTALVAAALTKHTEKLNTVARKRVGGLHRPASSEIFVRPDTRSEVYASAAHEFIHHLTHPAFTAAFSDEKHIVEGFTEFMTREVVSTSNGYPEEYAKISSMKSAMTNPFGTSVAGSVNESMRLAYFKGRLDLMGWKPSGPDEEKAVAEKGGSGAWDSKIGEAKEIEYHQRAIAAQRSRSNVLGFGLYFTRKSDAPIIAVDYVRVLKSSEFARGQLLLQGQLLGTPEAKPTLGGSLGIAGEYQAPWFYLQSGVRAVGTVDLDTEKGRIDIAPFAGAGFRWWRARVGLEGIVLFPVLGSGIDVGIGGSVSIELGAHK